MAAEHPAAQGQLGPDFHQRDEDNIDASREPTAAHTGFGDCGCDVCCPEPGPSSAATCRYCAGKGGRYRLVYSRFLGCEPQTHEGPWEKCWACNGSGKLDADALADLGHDRETISGG